MIAGVKVWLTLSKKGHQVCFVLVISPQKTFRIKRKFDL